MAEDSSQASAIGGPSGGQIVTPAQQNPGLDSQFSKYIRSFYQAQSNIKGADRQLARVCGDRGITTYFDQNFKQSIVQRTDKPMMSAGLKKNCSTDGQGRIHRICYICGEKIYGKANMKAAYAAAEKPTQFPQDPRSSEIEHVADMSMASPFGILAEQGHPTLKRNFMQYEYLWAHNRCNKAKNDRSLIAIYNDGPFHTDIFLCLKLQFKILSWLEVNAEKITAAKRWIGNLKKHMGGVSYDIYETHYTPRNIIGKKNSDIGINKEINDNNATIKQQNELVNYIETFVDALNGENNTEGVFHQKTSCYPNAAGGKPAEYKNGILTGDGWYGTLERLYDIWKGKVVVEMPQVGNKRPRTTPKPKQLTNFINFCRNPVVGRRKPGFFINIIASPIIIGDYELTDDNKKILNVDVGIQVDEPTKIRLLLKSGISVDVLNYMKTIFNDHVNKRYNDAKIWKNGGEQELGDKQDLQVSYLKMLNKPPDDDPFEKTWVNEVLEQMTEIEEAATKLPEVGENIITDSQQIEDTPDSDYILESTQDLLRKAQVATQQQGQRRRAARRRAEGNM